jgi:hypothetical protein
MRQRLNRRRRITSPSRPARPACPGQDKRRGLVFSATAGSRRAPSRRWMGAGTKCQTSRLNMRPVIAKNCHGSAIFAEAGLRTLGPDRFAARRARVRIGRFSSGDGVPARPLLPDHRSSAGCSAELESAATAPADRSGRRSGGASALALMKALQQHGKGHIGREQVAAPPRGQSLRRLAVSGYRSREMVAARLLMSLRHRRYRLGQPSAGWKMACMPWPIGGRMSFGHLQRRRMPVRHPDRPNFAKSGLDTSPG